MRYNHEPPSKCFMKQLHMFTKNIPTVQNFEVIISNKFIIMRMYTNAHFAHKCIITTLCFLSAS
jgi:hypothetical protein